MSDFLADFEQMKLGKEKDIIIQETKNDNRGISL